MKGFPLSAVSENHLRIEAALSEGCDAFAGPAILRELFECLSLATGDAHLSDRYSAILIAAINTICRNCSHAMKESISALNALEAVFRDGDSNTRAYAADAAYLLKTPGALRFLLKAAEDPEVLRRCMDLDSHVDELVGMVYSVSPADALVELGRMLGHPSSEMRHYAAGRLLMFGAPGSPEALAKAAHRILADAAKGGCRDAMLLFSKGREWSAFPERRPHGPRGERLAKAACKFYESMRKDILSAEKMQNPPKKMRRKAPGKPALRLIKAGKPAGPS